MKAYIRQHFKIITIITAVIICTCLGIASPVIIAKMQPVLSEELKVVSFKMEKDVYEYTGEEIEPKIVKITFEKDKDEVFITDFRRYSFLLNNTYIPDTLKDKNEFDLFLKKKIK